LGRTRALELLESSYKVAVAATDKEMLLSVARTSLRTKVEAELADKLAVMVVEGIMTIRRGDKPIDLFMVEIVSMQHRSALDTRLVKGIVLDHGSRHPGMPKRLTNCWILTLNVSLEYEKTEVNSEAIYSTAEERDRLVEAERRFIDDRVRRIIDLKRTVCAEEGTSFVIINQKGIDPPSLDMYVLLFDVFGFVCVLNHYQAGQGGYFGIAPCQAS
jgi:T-complex protein 1 subunit zeta